MPDWITINSKKDLPEHVDYADWYIQFQSGRQGWFSWHVEDWFYLGINSQYGKPVAYWSKPHIDKYPTIPPYTPPSGKDMR